MKIEEIHKLIDDKALETPTLEFKSGAALSRSGSHPKEMVKDISAMTNAAGGRIIYGIAEDGEKRAKHAAKLAPVVDPSITSDWITQILTSHTSPPVRHFEIESIEAEGGRIFVIDVRQGDTAHQSLYDCIYYQRIGAQAAPMQDFQIRDVMNRRASPALEINLIRKNVKNESQSQIHCYFPKINNVGGLTVSNWRLHVEVPGLVFQPLSSIELNSYSKSKCIERVQLTDPVLPHGFQRIVYNSSALAKVGLGEIHPGDSFNLFDETNLPTINLRLAPSARTYLATHQTPLKWKFFSLNARPASGHILFEDWYVMV